MFCDHLGMKLKVATYRKMHNWSQEDLGAKAGLNQSQISRMEREARGIRIDHLERVAAALNVPVSELLDESGEERNEFAEFYRFFKDLPDATKRHLINFTMSMPGPKN